MPNETDPTEARQTTSEALIPEGKETADPPDLDQADQRQRTHQETATSKATPATTQESQWQV